MITDRYRVLRRLFLAAVVFQLLFALSRIPGSVYGKRLNKLAAWQELGPYRYYTRQESSPFSAELDWLLANTGDDAVILFTREAKDRHPMDFYLAFARLCPRILVLAEGDRVADLEVAGRRPTRGRPPGGGEGRLILVARQDRIALEVL